MSVQTVDCEDMNCGQYISEGVWTEVFCSAYAIMHFRTEVPLGSRSCLKLKFSEGINIEKLINKARDA